MIQGHGQQPWLARVRHAVANGKQARLIRSMSTSKKDGDAGLG